MIIFQNNKRITVYGIITFVIIAIFSFFNVYYSALFGKYTANRTNVYYLIAVIICVEMLFVFLSSFRYVTLNWFSTTLAVLMVYIFCVDYIMHINLWTIIVHCGTLFLWIATYRFIEKSLHRFPDTYKYYYCFMLLFFYGFALLSIFAQRDIADLRGQGVAVVNLSYYCLACLPLLLLGKNKRIVFLHIITSLLISMFSFKRGAIITAIFMLLAYYYVDGKIKRKTISTWAKVLMVSVLVIIFLMTVDYYSGGILSSRFTKVSLLDGSGRSRIVKNALDLISQRGFFYRLIGTGSGTSSMNVGITLHNDYLEFLFCFGYVGLIIYIFIIIQYIVRIIKLIKIQSEYAVIMSVLFAFIIGLSLFEGVLFNFAFLYVVIEIAIIEHLISHKKNDGEVSDVK